MPSDAVVMVKTWLRESGPIAGSPAERAIREVLAELEDCERDHPPEPWASELKAEIERLRAKFKLMKCGHPAYCDDSYGGCTACQFHARDMEAEANEARIESALALHPAWDGMCGCGGPWPCRTVKALQGEEGK